MEQKLTSRVEDIINEPTKKCEFCNQHFPKDEMVEQKIEGGEVVEICIGCLEALEDERYCNDEPNLEKEMEQAEMYREDEAIEQHNRAVEPREVK